MGNANDASMSHDGCWESGVVARQKDDTSMVDYTWMMKSAHRMQVFEWRGADWDLT